MKMIAIILRRYHTDEVGVELVLAVMEFYEFWGLRIN
jgi:hypothetical protein